MSATKTSTEASTSVVAHHKRLEYCTTRLKYRQGRQLKAVKTYTVANESQHLVVFGVPKINLEQELKRKLRLYGDVTSLENISNELSKKMELEQFTDAFHVRYKFISQSRRAKRQLDAKQFYGGILHISYAPEYETIEELQEKLAQREKDVRQRLKINASTAKRTAADEEPGGTKSRRIE